VFEERIEGLTRTEGGKESEDTPLFLLNEISSRIEPQIDVRLSEFIADDKEFAISGTTVSFVSIDKIRDAVQQIKGTGAVELQSIDRITGGQVRFKLRGKL